jgi:broad specificity phosphatase PhoE
LSGFWSKLIADEKAPIPGTIYTSPLARCLETTRLVFQDVFDENDVPFRPVIEELLRERLTDHTCDRRSTRSWIKKEYPNYTFNPDISEVDQLWKSDRWESDDAHAARIQLLFENIFDNDDNQFVALVTHSYTISAILTVLGMRTFRMKEGSCFAILVKAEKLAAI